MFYSNQKYLLITIIFSLSFTVNAENKFLEKVESDVIDSEGAKSDITKRAKNCIAQHVSNDALSMSGGTKIFGGFGSQDKQNTVNGGDVIVNVDVEGGVVTANSRKDYRSMMVNQNVQSTLTFFAKDGRFKMRHTNIKSAQKSSGSVRNGGYSKVRMSWGGGAKKITTVLQEVSNTVAKCVNTKETDW